MTPSMPDLSSVWDRTLPKPDAILESLPQGTFARRNSSLLQHHFETRSLSQDFLEGDPDRRSTVPCISYYGRQSLGVGDKTRMIDSTSCTPALPPISPSLVLMKKRNASHMAEEPPSRPKSPSSPITGDGAREFCLCQPDPKIPRPRNAFILYRQHQQAAVVAQHPGLPNPEISKIIGEQWQSLPEKSKNEWKALAEVNKGIMSQQRNNDLMQREQEEKARHQQQYPDYRYQPRRNGRHSNASSVSGASGTQSATVSEQGTCLKCFGKVMNPPNTPYTNYFHTSGGGPPSGMMTMHPPRRAYTVTTGPPNPRTQVNGGITSPRSARVRPYSEVFGQQPQPDRRDPRFRYAAHTAPLSPESHKRRRFNGKGVLIPGRGEVYSQQGLPYSAMERSMTRPEIVQGPRMAMAPPPRGAYLPSAGPQLQQFRTQYTPAPRDPSLVLPPLKTLARTFTPPQTQKSGTEAMIRSIPALNKLKFLEQISPPLSNPSNNSSQFEIRGAILAIEGLNIDSIWNMTNSLAEQLEKDGHFAVRIFGGPDPYACLQNPRSAASGEHKAMSMEDFLATIGQWHRISKEMIKYITTKPKPIHFNTTSLDTRMTDTPREPPPDSAVSPGTMSKAAQLSLVSPTPASFFPPPSTSAAPTPAVTLPKAAVVERTSPRRTPPTPPPTSPPKLPAPSPAHSATNPNPVPPPPPSLPPHHQHIHHHNPPHQSNVIPIAIIPHYQLTTVDTSAMSLPITDLYSPLSHWQWLATLWRGCVGADVTVVVEDANAATVTEGSSGVDGRGGGGAGSSGIGVGRSSVSASTGGETIQEGVEVRLQDARAVVVRLGLDASVLSGEGWEKAKRRVGFEVEEFLRAAGR